ncbi:dynein light chain Tctex-type 1-like [Octopus sinensis]|uniref:Dynein light chain Tctex-type 1-like n=1 Tax=Octopus sinensis TaxID=2607531 RepID=A0A7E6EL44_9MOLL|nr:dynein light chain Tctex-type 1-like [Octopus sinensis]
MLANDYQESEEVLSMSNTADRVRGGRSDQHRQRGIPLLHGQSIESIIGNNVYQQKLVNQWTADIIDQCLNNLSRLNKPFKYIGWSCRGIAVTCIISQKSGAGLHTASSCYWDSETDGCVSVGD